MKKMAIMMKGYTSVPLYWIGKLDYIYMSFTNRKSVNSTLLSTHICLIDKMGKSSIIKWDIAKNANDMKKLLSKCRLRLEEKLCILSRDIPLRRWKWDDY